MRSRIVQHGPAHQPGHPTPDAQGHGGPRPRNLAARMGRWSSTHRRTAIFGWLAFVIAAFAVGSVAPMQVLDRQAAGVGESGRADRIIAAAFPQQKDGLGEFVVLQSSRTTVDDSAFHAAVNDTLRVLSSFEQVQHLRSPFAAGNGGQISPDRHAVLVEFVPRGDYATAAGYIDRITRAVAAVQTRHPQLYVGEAGVSTEKAIDTRINGGIAKAGLIAIPLTLLVLLLVLGSGMAALVPVALSLTAVFATFGLIGLPSKLVPMDGQVQEVILLIGLAVGVDYALFYMRRERDERRAGRSEQAALEAAAATSGRSVLISGFTVMIAMAGMFLSSDKAFMSFAVGTMLVVGVAMLGSLTVLPAILASLGDRIELGRIPILHRLRRDTGEGSRFWGAILRPVLRHPRIATLASAGLLVLLAAPALSLHTANSGIDSLPRSLPELQAAHAVNDAFPGGAAAAVVAIKSPDSPRLQAAIADLKERALATGELRPPIHVERSADRTVAQVEIPLAGEGTDDASNHALATLRHEILPATIGLVPGVQYAVTGETAESKDFTDRMKETAPLVFGFVLLFAFLLLLAAFRSVVVALKAIVLNLLSVAAAYGMLVAIFQWGWGQGLLDFSKTGGIAAWLPMFMFVILFGLSMDYHVFILSRIREAFDRGLSTEDAVEQGIRQTAGVVTGASLVMVGVFSVFAVLPLLDLKEMGIGLAAAILIDATIVRAVLLPASMRLLGDRNWYLPRWLGWLPRLEHEPALLPSAAAA